MSTPSNTAMSQGTRRILVGICLVFGGVLIEGATLNYMLTPMLDELGLSQEDASVALTIPWVASLLVVFAAGRLGDRRGHREVISWASVVVILGSVLVAAAEGITLVALGLLLESLGATTIQIVTLGLLSDRFSAPSARSAAFGTFGMVSPAVWLMFPVLAGVLIQYSWRLVPLVWALGGLLALAMARLLLPAARRTERLGDMATPVLAGITLSAFVQTVTRIGDDGLLSWWTLATASVTILCGLLLLVLLRHRTDAGFSLGPLRVGATRALLIVVIIVPFINTVFLMTMAFQYLYGLSVLQTALALVPAQLAAVLGSRLVAAPLMRRWGLTRTAQVFFLLTSAFMLLSFAVTPSAPLWIPIAYIAGYNALTVAASITVTNAVMNADPAVGSGVLSAYRMSAGAVGGSLAVVVMNSVVFALSRWFMQTEFEQNGLDSQQAQQQMAAVQEQSTSPALIQQYSVPLPDGTDVSSVIADTIATGIHVNGVLGSVLALVCVLLVTRAARSEGRRPADRSTV